MKNSTHHQELLDEPARIAVMTKMKLLLQLELKLTGSKQDDFFDKNMKAKRDRVWKMEIGGKTSPFYSGLARHEVSGRKPFASEAASPFASARGCSLAQPPFARRSEYLHVLDESHSSA
jgi:hypothetical protein